MNAPFTPRYAKNIAEAVDLLKHANALHHALAKSGGRYSTAALEAYLQAAVAAQSVFGDDIAEAIDNTRQDLGIDSEGYPLNEWGDTDLRADRVFVPAGAGR